MKKSKNPKLKLLYESIKYGSELLKNEFMNEERKEKIRKKNEEVTDLIDYVDQLAKELEAARSLLIEIDPKEIIKYQDIDQLLEAIGAERVGEWFMGLGSR